MLHRVLLPYYQVSSVGLGVNIRCINKVLYVGQVFGGRVQENSLLPMARQPDGLQSRLLILHNLENYAKFQVDIHQMQLPSQSGIVCCCYCINVYIFFST